MDMADVIHELTWYILAQKNDWLLMWKNSHSHEKKLDTKEKYRIEKVFDKKKIFKKWSNGPPFGLFPKWKWDRPKTYKIYQTPTFKMQ